MTWSSNDQYKVVADKIVSLDEDIVISVAGGVYMSSIETKNEVATFENVGLETPYVIAGGTDGTQPTFTGAPLFSGTYVRTVGRLVHFQIQVDMDNITSFGTGQYFVSLPFNAKYGYNFRDGCYHDISTGTDYHVSGHVFAGSNLLQLNTSVKVGGSVEDSPFTSTNPVALHSADNFHIAGAYIAEAE